MLAASAKLGLGPSASPQGGLVSDPASYKSLALTARTGGAAGLEAAAKAFESLLVGQMLRQMREATLADGIFDSSQSQIYQDLYDQQIATLMSEGDGMGIRKALLRQLAPKRELAHTAHDPEDLAVPERNLALKSIKRRKIDAALEAVAATTVDSEVEPASTASGSGTSAAMTIEVKGTGQWPPSNAEEFVAYLKPYADQAAEALGMDTSILLAQSALETGWGKHVPQRADGSSSFNLFGIKADRSWQGDRVAVGTLEYRDGVARREQAQFRAYATPADSLVDYVAFLRRNPRYGEALQSGTAEDFIRGLQSAGYATDPRYANKVLGIRERMLRLGDAAETQVSVNEADTQPEG